MTRPSRDIYFSRMAQLVATRGTCLRRRVGCVLVSARGHVLATGYNGVAAGLPHCNQVTGVNVSHPACPAVYGHACPGAFRPSGTDLDRCEAIHAEQNALLQCRNVFEIHTAYCTTEPCVTCTKLLLNTSCGRIVALEGYPASGKELWLRAGRGWVTMPSSLTEGSI